VVTATVLRPCIGIDPGNESAGIALVSPAGDLVASATVRIWTPGSLELGVARLASEIMPDWREPLVALEKPSKGLGRDGYGGVREAGGFVLGEIVRRFRTLRKDVRRPQASEWRKGEIVPKDREAWKAWAISEATGACLTAGVPEPRTEDEAEAILIAFWGWASQPAGSKGESNG
jgi:hypothetical protein